MLKKFAQNNLGLKDISRFSDLPWRCKQQGSDPFKRAPVPPESILNLVEETQGQEKVRKKTPGQEKVSPESVLKRIRALSWDVVVQLPR